MEIIPLLLIIAFAFLLLGNASPTSRRRRPKIRFKPAPETIGAQGERRVENRFNSDLDKAEYLVLNDLTLPFGNGTTQIDHVVVSRFGIFVVETKNYSGWIYGDAEQSHWTQVNFSKKNRFLNPVLQNKKHIKAVRQTTGISDLNIHGWVAFVGDAEPKTKMPAMVVWSAEALTSSIRSVWKPVLSAEEVHHAQEKLRTAALERNAETHKAHVTHVQEKLAAKAQKDRCPRCGDELAKRTNRNSGKTFWGCRNFPRCRGTRQSIE